MNLDMAANYADVLGGIATNKNFFRRDFVEYVEKLLDENPQVFNALEQFYGLESDKI